MQCLPSITVTYVLLGLFPYIVTAYTLYWPYNYKKSCKSYSYCDVTISSRNPFMDNRIKGQFSLFYALPSLHKSNWKNRL